VNCPKHQSVARYSLVKSIPIITTTQAGVWWGGVGWGGGGGGGGQKLEKTTFAKSPEPKHGRERKKMLGIINGLPIFSNNFFARVNIVGV
jgi:hypothetical protein